VCRPLTTCSVVEGIFLVIVLTPPSIVFSVLGSMVGEAGNRQLLRRALASAEKNGDANRPIIKLRGLVNGFGGKVLHDHIDLEVRRGEILGVVGGSGAGKSVLLRSIIGLNQPVGGTAEVFGQTITGDMDSPAMRYLEMRWGAFSGRGAVSSQNVIENIQVPLREYTEMQSLMDEIAEMKIAMGGFRPIRATNILPNCRAA
jgi:ABC-type transporter Mla maintaining outer membrane lipid asymmetry ATPase subunit MlaF